MKALEEFEVKVKTIKECIELVVDQIKHKENYKKELIEDGCDTRKEEIEIKFGHEIHRELNLYCGTYENCIDILERNNK